MAAALAGFSLIIAVFVKIFPLLAVWEVAEHYEEEKIKVPRREVVAALEPAPVLRRELSPQRRLEPDFGRNPRPGAHGGAA